MLLHRYLINDIILQLMLVFHSLFVRFDGLVKFLLLFLVEVADSIELILVLVFLLLLVVHERLLEVLRAVVVAHVLVQFFVHVGLELIHDVSRVDVLGCGRLRRLFCFCCLWILGSRLILTSALLLQALLLPQAQSKMNPYSQLL